jgi:hypothetical protein
MVANLGNGELPYLLPNDVLHFAVHVVLQQRQRVLELFGRHRSHRMPDRREGLVEVRLTKDEVPLSFRSTCTKGLLLLSGRYFPANAGWLFFECGSTE